MAERNGKQEARASQLGVAEYLDRHLATQDYAAYSADEHAVWRDVLARNSQVVAQYAARIHPDYLDGLRRLELPTAIPRTEDLNERLRSTGWKIVPVDGYIPATSYAALMAENIFPVSLRIRRREHIDFAPEPDMVHDILGHLPMLFCAEHRDYLRELALCAMRATPNELDSAFHEAVRHMAELKSTPGSNREDVAKSEQQVEQVYAKLTASASEVTCLRRIYTWSIEFGLFGTPEDFTVHGAALLSAPNELERVLSGAALLQAYSLSVTDYENTFSDLLSQYFFAKDYGHLHQVLAAYTASMHQSIYPGVSEVRELRPQAFERARRNNA